MTTHHSALQNQALALVSIWKRGAIGAALLAVLVEAQTVVDMPDATSVMINLVLGTPANFLLYWPLAAFVAWVWRKLESLSWMAKIIIIAVFLAILTIILRLLLGEEKRTLFHF